MAASPNPVLKSKPSSRFAPSVLALVALLVGLALVSLGLFVWRNHEEAQNIAASRAAGGAFAASTYASWLIQANMQALQRVADAVALDSGRVGAPAVQDLNQAVAALPGEIAIWVFDADGRALLSSEPGVEPVEIADREYFVALRNGSAWHIGFLITTRVTERKVFTVARRIERDGRFAGAIVSYVPAQLLARFWQSMGFGPGSTVGLVRDDGFLVARYPIPEATIDLSDYVLFTHHLKQAPEGVYQSEASPADGVARRVGYRRVEGLPLVTVVGIPLTGFTEGLLHASRRAASVVVPIGLALLLVFVLVVRVVRQEAATRRALEDSLDRNRMLLREVHHRVKNNLQMVMSLIQHRPGPREEKQQLMERIAAIAQVHEQIYAFDQTSQINIGAYLAALVDELRRGHSTDVRLESEIAELSGTIEQAQALGLIVTEVVANAFKHGFPAGGPGEIRVDLAEAEAGQAVLRVRDNGPGFAPTERTGFGMRLIRELARQIDGKFEFASADGTEFRMTFPIPDQSHPQSVG